MAIIFLVAAYFIIVDAFPKNATRFPFFLVFLGLDFYLWFSIRKKIIRFRPVIRYLVTILYWIPFVVFILTMLIAMLVPVYEWNTVLLTYLTGFVIMFYAAKILAIIFFFMADIYRVVHFSIRYARAKKRKEPFNRDHEIISRGRFLRTLGLAGGGLLFSGMLIGVVKWAYDFKVRRVSLRLPALPESFRGLKIVQISDIHLGSWVSKEPLQEAVNLVNELDPDLVLFTGDLVNFTTREAYKFRDTLQEIRSQHGIYAILGNHDYGDYVNWPTPEAKENNMAELYRFYRDLNWNLLRNENEILQKGPDQLAIIGVENWSAFHHFKTHGNLKKAIKGTEGVPVKILMSHDPSHWEKEVSIKYPEIDVTLSGHTHGFQFGVDLKNFHWSFAQYMFKYWAGLYSIDSGTKPQYLYVNRGLGMIGYPGRVGVLPEITLITLE
jgi:predicted MPP superfamily phosphohydrolase